MSCTCHNSDDYQSLGSGRPPVFHMHEIDCRYPDDTDAEVGEDGKVLPGRECHFQIYLYLSPYSLADRSLGMEARLWSKYNRSCR